MDTTLLERKVLSLNIGIPFLTSDKISFICIELYSYIHSMIHHRLLTDQSWIAYVLFWFSSIFYPRPHLHLRTSTWSSLLCRLPVKVVDHLFTEKIAYDWSETQIDIVTNMLPEYFLHRYNHFYFSSHTRRGVTPTRLLTIHITK